jgi:hypothetical protein
VEQAIQARVISVDFISIIHRRNDLAVFQTKELEILYNVVALFNKQNDSSIETNFIVMFSMGK